MSVYQIESTASVLPELSDALGIHRISDGDRFDVSAEIARGGFGVVFKCEPATPTQHPPAPALILKTYSGVHPRQHLQVLSALHKALRNEPDTDWTEHLPGMPIWCGTVRTDMGLVQEASIALDLSAQGFVALDEIVENDLLRRELLSLSITDRAEIAQGLSAGCAVLESVSFIHADINSENVFVDLTLRRATLIDFDSGALKVTGAELPLTRGKPGIFVAPELIGPRGTICEDRISTGSERWSAGTAIGHILFGTSPLFFLRNTGIKTLHAYAARFCWPEIAETDPLFFSPNADAYLAMRGELDHGPVGIVSAFAALYGPGIDHPDARPNGRDWVCALQYGPPQFDLISVDARVVFQGTQVTIGWAASRAREVYINGQGPYPASHQLDVTMHTSGRLRLVAIGTGDKTVAESTHVTVLRLPMGPATTQPTSASIPRFAVRTISPPRYRLPELPSAPKPGLQVPTTCAVAFPRMPKLRDN